MTKRQIAESNMLEIVDLHFNDYPSVLNELKMIEIGALSLADKKKDIDFLEKQQEGSTKGVTAIKNTTFADIKIAGETHRSNLCNLCKKINKIDILADFTMTVRAFKSGGEEKVLTRCKELLKAARTVEMDASAEIYKVSKDENDAFEVLLNSFQLKKNNQSTKKNTQKKITSDLTQAFSEVHAILKQLDSDVRNNAATKYPDFTKGYFIARKVVVR